MEQQTKTIDYENTPNKENPKDTQQNKFLEKEKSKEWDTEEDKK